MTARDFIEQEKKDGLLADKAKNSGHVTITAPDVYALMEKYAKHEYEKKVKHLDLNKLQANYVKGRESVCKEMEETLLKWRQELEDEREHEKSLKTSKKYIIYSLDEKIYQLISLLHVVMSKKRLSLKNKEL